MRLASLSGAARVRYSRGNEARRAPQAGPRPFARQTNRSQWPFCIHGATSRLRPTTGVLAGRLRAAAARTDAGPLRWMRGREALGRCRGSASGMRAGDCAATANQARCAVGRVTQLHSPPERRSRLGDSVAVGRPSVFVALAGQVFWSLLGELPVEHSGGLADFDQVAVGVSM